MWFARSKIRRIKQQKDKLAASKELDRRSHHSLGSKLDDCCVMLRYTKLFAFEICALTYLIRP